MTKFKKNQKSDKKYGKDYKHMHILRLWKKHVQSSKKISIKLYEELCSRGTHCLYIEGKNDYVHNVEKSKKKIFKTVRGVVLTTGTSCLYIKGEKRQCGKSDKK